MHERKTWPRRPEQWQPIRPPLTEIFTPWSSDTAIATAYREHGDSLREIADHLGRHYTTISRRLHHAEKTLSERPS